MGEIELFGDGCIEVEEAGRAVESDAAGAKSPYRGNAEGAGAVIDSRRTEARCRRRAEERVHGLRRDHVLTIGIGTDVAARSTSTGIRRARVDSNGESRVGGHEI